MKKMPPRAPLRKVIERVEVDIGYSVTVTREKLECGHVIPIVQDFYGNTYAERRRCKQCMKEDKGGGRA